MMRGIGIAVAAAIAALALATPTWASNLQISIQFNSEYGVSLWVCKFDNKAGLLIGKCGVGYGAEYSATGKLTDKELTIDIDREGEHLISRGVIDAKGGFSGVYGSGSSKGTTYAKIE